jgi:hypothetical protein
MREVKVTEGSPVDVRISAPFTNTTTGRVTAKNKSNQTVTLNAGLRFYISNAVLSIPASYVTAANLPATVTVYATTKGVERTVETISLSLATPAVVTDMATQAELDAAIANKADKPAPVVKRGMLSLGMPTTNQAQAGTVTAWSERMPVKLPLKTKRWRLRVANWNINANSAPTAHTTPYTISDIYFGTPSGTFNGVTGRLTGAYASTPVKVATGGNVPIDGTDWVSEWVTDEAFQFGPDMKMFGWALTAPATGSGVGLVQVKHGFRNSAGGANATLGVASGSNYFGQVMALDKRIEYEVETNVPVGFFIGASGTAGYNLVAGQGGGFEPVYTHETYPGVWANRHKGIMLNNGASGARQNPFRNSTYWTYTRWAGIHQNADFAILDLGGNSVLNLQSSSSALLETLDVIQRCREFGIKRIYLCTILPIGETAGSAIEVIRQAYNGIIRTNPWGVDGSMDIDLILRDPANPLSQVAGYVDTDKIHPLIPGYNRVGMQINVS